MRLAIFCRQMKSRILVEVKDLLAAQTTWNEYRNWNDIASSDMKRGCGNILQDGKVVAHVSYNGRLWRGKDTERPTEEIIPSVLDTTSPGTRGMAQAAGDAATEAIKRNTKSLEELAEWR